MRYFLSTIFTLLFCIFLLAQNIIAQVVNDIPGRALLMTDNGSNWFRTYTANFQTATETYPTSCVPSQGADIWFKFEASGPKYAIYPVLNSNGQLFDVHAELFTDPDSSPLLCTNIHNLSNGIHDIIPGQTYFLRLYHTQNATHVSNSLSFRFIKIINIQHGTCENAKEVTIAHQGYTVLRDTTYFLPESKNCLGDKIGSRWYSFVADYPNYVFEGSRGYYFQIYEDCNNAPLICEHPTNSSNNNVAVSRTYNLQPGKRYLIELYKPFSIAIETSSLQIHPSHSNTGDICETAIRTPVNDFYEFVSLPNPSTFGQTIYKGCPKNGMVDTWHKFEASYPTHVICIKPDNTTFPPKGFSVFESCADRDPILCTEQHENVIHNLSPGKEYYIKVNNFSNSGSNTDIGIKTLKNPISNDECEKAIYVPIHQGQSTLIEGNLANATLSSNSNCISNPVSDLWYSFEASSPVHFINLRGTRISYEVYANCEANTPLFCSQKASTQLSDLLPGQTYLIKIIRTSLLDSLFSFTIESESYANCQTPKILFPTTNERFSSHSIFPDIRDASSIPCVGPRVRWFRFTAQTPKYILKLRSKATLHYVLKPTCDNTEPIMACSTTFANEALLSSMEPGREYLIGVSNQVGFTQLRSDNTIIDFSISLQEFPNDECAGAITLNENEEVTSNVRYATRSGEICGVSSNVDLWYKFIPNSSATQITIKGNSYIRYELLEESCNGGVIRYCSPYQNIEYQDVFNLKPDLNYFLKVACAVDFTIKINNLTPVAGDACSNPINWVLISDSSSMRQLDFKHAGNEAKSCVSYTNYNSSLWYRFKPISSKTRIVLDNKNTTLELFADCHQDSLLHCIDFSTRQNNALQEIFDLNNDQFYLARVTIHNPNVNVAMSIQSYSLNDNCETAQEVSALLNPDTVFTNLINASPSYVPTCNNRTYPDLWYTFTTLEDRIEISYTSTENVRFQILSGCQSTSIYCDPDFSKSKKTIVPDLNKHETYYLRFVSGLQNHATPLHPLIFTVRSVTPTSNEKCFTPTAITISDTEYIYTKNTPEGTSINADNTVDAWFVFIPHDDNLTIKFPEYANVLLKDSCNQESGLTLSNNGKLKVISGKKYYLRVRWAQTEGNLTSIAIKAHPTPINDLCESAIILSPTQTTATFIQANLRNANSEKSNCSSKTQDIWYKFTTSTNSTTIRLRTTNTSTRFSLYENCLKRTSHYCKADSLFTFTSIPGETYFLSIHTTQATFDTDIPFELAVIENPSYENLSCPNARPFTSHISTPDTIRINFQTVPAEQSTNQKHLWYTFIASDKTQIIWINSTRTDISYRLASSCNEFLIHDQDDRTLNSSNYRLKYSELEPGKKYYLNVRQSNNTQPAGHTSFYVTGPTAPNDERANATYLHWSCDRIGTTDMFTSSRSSDTHCFPKNKFDSDIWFEFRTDHIASAYALELSSQYWPTNANVFELDCKIELYEADSEFPIQCISHGQTILSNDYWEKTSLEFLFDNLKINTTYYIKFIHTGFSSQDHTSPFKLIYNFIRSAKPDFMNNSWGVLTPDECVFFDPCDKTSSSSEINTPVGILGFYDNWYHFYATDTLVRFVFNNNLYYELRNNEYTFPLNSFYTSNNKDTILISDIRLVKDQVYLLRVASRSRSAYTSSTTQACIYDMSEQHQASSCLSPFILQHDQWISSKINQTNKYFSSCIQDTLYNESWFEIEASETQNVLIVEGENNKFDIQLYSLCDEILECYKAETLIHRIDLDLTPNQRYFVKVSSILSHPETSFRIMHSTEDIITANDYYDNSASKITVYPNPAHSILHIKGRENQYATIIHTDGTKLASIQIQNGTISIAHLPSGIYILDIEGEKTKFTIIK